MTKITLFALMATGLKEAHTMLEDAVRLVGNSVIEPATVVMSEEGAVVLGREESRCLLSIGAAVNYPAIVRISTFLHSPENGGLCWEALMALHLEWPRDVWISTYSKEDLGADSQLTPLRIDGRQGYVVSSESFERLFP